MPKPEPAPKLAPSDDAEEPDPTFPIVIGLLLPWLLFLAAFTPRAWWGLSFALLTLLGGLLALSARWAYVHARERGLNPARWAALTVVTLGTALLILGPSKMPRNDLLDLEMGCKGCGGFVRVHEPFCYGCGEYN